MVDVLVMLLTDREQIVEVGAAEVAPPDDVVQFGAAVAHPAARGSHRSRRRRRERGVAPGWPVGSMRPRSSSPGASMITPLRTMTVCTTAVS